MQPMLATVADRPPAGPGWLHEVKWDGMRVLADVSQGQLRLTSRTGRDVTAIFPELAGLAGLYPDLLLDGEVVVMRRGIPSFAALAERFGASGSVALALSRRAPVTYMVFDLLRLYGVDLTGRMLRDRRSVLDRLELAGEHWQVPEPCDDGAALWQVTREHGLEGTVSKRLTSRYAAGTRSSEWVKVAHRQSHSLVIGGWRAEEGSPGRLGAVLVGVPDRGGLRYVGRVGSGLAGRVGLAVTAELAELTSQTCPFATEVPAQDAHGAQWVHPVLVVEVRCLGMTESGCLRQPTFKGLRHDLTAGDVAAADSGDA